MSDTNNDRTIEKLLRQQAALAAFGSFAFRERDLSKILTEAARICAASLGVPFCKICRYRTAENDLLIEAGVGWHAGVDGRVVSAADETSPQGRAYITGEPVIIRDLDEANSLAVPAFYREHGIVSTIDVVIPSVGGDPYGVLEVDSPTEHQYDMHDVAFLTGFANVLAEAVAAAKQTAALRALVDEKNLLAEELQHRVRNNLQMITAMLSSYARTAEETVQQGVSAIVRRVMALAQVYDSLLGVGLSETIDLAGYIEALCNSLPGMQDEPGARIALVCHAEPLQLQLDQVTAIGMITAELVGNAFRHAFPSGGGTITVGLACGASGRDGTLTIRDDGTGFVADPHSARRGMSLVRRLATQVGGTLMVESDGGTVWTLAFQAQREQSRQAA